MDNTSFKFSITGIRGIAGASLNREVVEKCVGAYMSATKAHKIVIARDSRKSGPEIVTWIIDLLKGFGCEIIDLGIATTPTGQYMVRYLEADGGIIVTASHNPPEWNGLKFVSPQGVFLDEIKVGEMKDLFERNVMPEKKNESLATLVRLENAAEEHVAAVLAHIDTEVIRNAKLKIVMDPDNGAGAVIDPVLASDLGLDVEIINNVPDGEFPRGTEPVPEHLGMLGDAVLKKSASVGFAQDPDADRLAIVDERGIPIGEEYTLALATEYILSKTPNVKNREIATNLSTSRMIDDIAKKYEVNVVRTKIGEIYVSKTLLETNGIIGGEGNGGVIWPNVGYGRDSIVGMALVLEYLAVSGKTISELVAALPHYETVKAKKEVSNSHEVKEALAMVEEKYTDYEIDLTDGVKVLFENGWLHVRASNTEPILRYFAEAPTKELAQQWVDSVLQ